MNSDHSSKALALALLSMMALIACQPEAASRSGAAKHTPPQEDSNVETANVANGKTTATQIFRWSGNNATFPEDDRRYLANLSSRYHDIFRGLDGKPESEALALGFPTAKEWLDARDLSNEELLDQMNQGNINAKAFHVDRQLETLENLISSSGAENITELFQTSPAIRDKYQQLAIDTQVAAAGLLKFHPSPFSAYMFGATSAITGGVDAPIPASMSVAGELGDSRSAELLKAYSAINEKMDPAAVMSSYSSMRKIAGLN